MVRCKRCGRRLTREESIKRSHGPVCIVAVIYEMVVNRLKARGRSVEAYV